jgi:hypothetical protein
MLWLETLLLLLSLLQLRPLLCPCYCWLPEVVGMPSIAGIPAVAADPAVDVALLLLDYHTDYDYRPGNFSATELSIIV